MFDVIKKDVQRYYQLEEDGLPTRLRLTGKLRVILSSHGLHVICSYRLASYIDTFWQRGAAWKVMLLPLKIVSVSWELLSVFLYGSLICREANIGPGFYIGHIGGIVIGPAEIGQNFTITHNFTLGAGKSGSGHGIPEIGDNVWIGTNVVVYGKIRIGSGVALTPGTILSKNIGDRILVGGNPARILNRDFDNSSLLFGTEEENNNSSGD